MTARLQSLTANPLRAFLAAGLAALFALFALPVAAWLPGTLVVFSLLANGARIAWAAAAGAACAYVWGLLPVFGVVPVLLLLVVLLLPSVLAAFALEKSRNLSFVFQALTAASCLFVVAIHVLLGDPVRALAPIIAELEPMLRQAAGAMTQVGFDGSAQTISAATTYAWQALGWMVLVQAFLAQCTGLWAYGRLRHPGLFGIEFRGLRLGQVIAWALVATFAASLIAHRLDGHGFQVVDDVLFVLAAAFLVQALAVMHGLRELQVIGALPLALAYVAVFLVPMALVGIGFADTWVRFRERFAPRQGV